MRFRIVVLTLVLGMASTAGALPAGADSTADATALIDLPAAVLTPGDAETVGIEGLGRFENGYFRTLADYIRIRSDFLQIPPAELEESLAEAGYLLGFTSNLGIPERPGDPQSPPIRVVFSSIYQYETAEGAAAAFALNTQYDAVAVATVDASLTPSSPIGDEAVMTRTTSATMEEEGPSDQIDAVFRVGNVLASTGIIDYGMTGDDVTNPGPYDDTIKAQVELLAARLIERIEWVQNGDAPNLWNRVLTLTATTYEPDMTTAGYRRIDGDDIPYYNGYEDDFSSIATPDMVAAFEVAQPLGDPAFDPFDPYFASRVFSFDSEDSASAFLAGIAAVPGAASELLPEAAGEVGADAKVLQYDLEIEPTLVALGYQVWQQQGPLVSMFLFESADHRPDLDVVLNLAGHQKSCLTDGCFSPAALPDSW